MNDTKSNADHRNTKQPATKPASDVAHRNANAPMPTSGPQGAKVDPHVPRVDEWDRGGSIPQTGEAGMTSSSADASQVIPADKVPEMSWDNVDGSGAPVTYGGPTPVISPQIAEPGVPGGPHLDPEANAVAHSPHHGHAKANHPKK